MYTDNDFRLYHHGILGQKWGKKNGPPYPLGASDHSASEKKAGWRKSLDSSGSVNRHRSSGSTSRTVKKSGGKTKEQNQKGLTDGQKKALIIGATALGTAVAAYGGYKVYKAIKTLDTETLLKSRKEMSQYIGREARDIKSSIKIAENTKYLSESLRNAKSVSEIRAYANDTIKSNIAENRTAKNVINAVPGEIKKDIEDFRSTLQTSRYSPVRNAFSSETDHSKIQRASKLLQRQKLSEKEFDRAIKDYERAISELDKLKESL